MIPQETVFKAMVHTGSYPHPVKSIQVRETHISKVFLTGALVYKIKKAVDLGFLDFTRLADRYRYCQLELNLNRRLTRNVYREVVPIIFDGTHIGIKRGGQVVEYAVCMRQLNADQSMLRLLRAGKLQPPEIVRIAEVLHHFYRAAPPDEAVTHYGDINLISQNCMDNFAALERFADGPVDGGQLRAIEAAVRAMLKRNQALFRRRQTEGFIRDGHGDLRCGHVYIEEEIQIIDCIEFDARYRCGDTAADIAFLAMDLDFEGFPGAARQLIETYAALAQDPGLLVLIDFYKCYRAMVRAKVNCLRMQDNCLPLGERNALTRHTRRFVELAFTYALCFSQPTLWVVCGLPASGKSTLADRLATLLGCTAFASDPIRKHLFGLAQSAAAVSDFAAGIYSPAADARTYAKLMLAAHERLAAGADVVLDATFSRAAQRTEAVRLAADQGANLIFVECHAPAAVLKERLAQRADRPGVSDARLQHLPDFLNRYTPFAEIDAAKHYRIDTTQPTSPQLLRLLVFDNRRRAEQAQKNMLP